MKTIRQHSFIVLLILTMLAGYFASDRLAWLADQSWLKWSIVVFTLFVMALPIEFRSLSRAFSRPTATIIACLISYVFIPLLMWPLSRLAGPVLGPGLIMVAAVPVTLASASVWTRRAGGDDSISMLVTIITNGACFVLTPLWMYWISSMVIERELLYGTIVKLLLFVVIPMAAAQLLRAWHKGLGAFAIRRKPMLSAFAQAGVLAMILIGAVKTGLKLSSGETTISTSDLLVTIAVSGFVHLVALTVAIAVARAFRLTPAEQIAVGISGSQKTLMIGLSAATSLGVTIIPLVVFQVFQLTADTMIADRWRQRYSPSPGGADPD